MVASTFANLSFENPPGTGPTLVNSTAELYPLNDGDILEIIFAGEAINVAFTEADFADISVATAPEVAAVFEAQVADLGASADGGFVRLSSLLTGEDVSLEIVGGAANNALDFPLSTVSGETYAGGAPNGWTTSTDTDGVTEWAAFADENSRPEEIFDGFAAALTFFEVEFSLGAAGAATDGLYRLTLDGTDYDYTATAVTRAAVVAALRIAVNGGGDPITASVGVDAETMLVAADNSGTVFTYSSLAPTSETWGENTLTPWMIFAEVSGFGSALFDLLFIPAPFETFANWSTFGYLTTFVGEQATFNTVELSDTFEGGWGTPTSFVLGSVALGVNPDDFESGWGSGYGIYLFDTALFATVSGFENFTGDAVVDWAFVCSINSTANGFWTAFVNGVPFTYESSGDTEAQIATALAGLVDGGLADVQASAVGDFVYIGPDPGHAGVDFVVTVTGPSISVIYAVDHPAFADQWIAQDRTPDFE